MDEGIKQPAAVFGKALGAGMFLTKRGIGDCHAGSDKTPIG